MSATIGKLAPTAVVVAVVAWCCYPYLDKPASEIPPNTDAGLQQEGNLPRIMRSLLSPVIGPASDRNPFKPWKANGTDSTGGEQPAIPGTAGKFPSRKEDAFDVSSNLVLPVFQLEATYIQGNRRVALINGQVCEPGDTLQISGSPTESCTVTRVFAHRVMIRHRGQIVELKYRDPAEKAKPSKPSEQRHE